MKILVWLLVAILSLIVIYFGCRIYVEMETKEIIPSENLINNVDFGEENIIDPDGGNVHYYVSGLKEGELLLMIHPAFSDHRAFQFQMQKFQKHFKVVLIDMIGHGKSYPKNNDGIDKITEYIKYIVDKEANGKINLLGISLGSLLAQYFYLKNPNMIKKMVLLGTYNINVVDKEVEKEQRSANIKLMIRALFSLKAFRSYAASITASTDIGQELFYETASTFTRKSFLRMNGLKEVIKNRNNRVEIPTLILAGETEMPIAIKKAKEWANKNDLLKFHIVPKAGHCANMDNPKEFNRLTLNFFNSM